VWYWKGTDGAMSPLKSESGLHTTHWNTALSGGTLNPDARSEKRFLLVGYDQGYG